MTLGELERGSADRGRAADQILASLAARVLTAAVQCQGSVLSGSYPELAFEGALTSLVDQDGPDVTANGAVPNPKPRSGRAEPVGLGVIQDLVQDAFGPVDFDRSSVVLETSSEPVPGCPAWTSVRIPRRS